MFGNKNVKETEPPTTSFENAKRFRIQDYTNHKPNVRFLVRLDSIRFIYVKITII